MQVQWKGIDLGRAVQMIKLQEEEEARANQEVDLAPVEVLYANLFGFREDTSNPDDNLISGDAFLTDCLCVQNSI